ncbi:Uncharacterized protein BM_BM1187 [Brugia malayi]|uniref:Bm1187 n=1 Tax=Brugia malayi TaxID=6279 RepID=A0A0J9XPF2_BRUMA|nr:Uncharacterized protein BM_BM1187 [Brugia malayi]CDP92370.1 Bm1187 [Brugia malayi]VIO94349.1 Uncharacterized protein BM_BM1187 [Brugia malayi]
MVYGLSLFNTVLIILFIIICTVLFIGNVFRFSWLQTSTVIKAKKRKRMYQCYVDSIRTMQMLQVETVGRSREALQQKYIESAQTLYTFFGVHRQTTLPNDMFMIEKKQ